MLMKNLFRNTQVFIFILELHYDFLSCIDKKIFNKNAFLI
jgi:hypothetical protein